MNRPGTTAPTVRPSGWWYLAAVGLVIGGLVAASFVLVNAWRDAEQAGFDTNLAGPGDEQPLTIAEPGGYTIAYVGPVIVSDAQGQRELADELDVSITPADGGDPLALAEYDGFYDFVQEGAQWVPLQTVHFDRPGDYVFRSSRLADVDSQRTVLAVSESPFRKLRDGAEAAVAIVVISILLAILVTVILAVTRKRAKAALPRHQPGWPPGGPPAGGGYAPGGPPVGGGYAPGGPPAGGGYAPGVPPPGGGYAPGYPANPGGYAAAPGHPPG